MQKKISPAIKRQISHYLLNLMMNNEPILEHVERFSDMYGISEFELIDYTTRLLVTRGNRGIKYNPIREEIILLRKYYNETKNSIESKTSEKLKAFYAE